MKLIVNTVNLKLGGALQRSISFLNELKIIGKDEYYIFYSDEVKNQINVESFPSNFKFYFFKYSPASLIKRKQIISYFNKLEQEINPDIVFSFVGPAYWRPKSIHLVGFGIPHIVYNDYLYVKKLPLKSKLEMLYKKFWTKYEADYFVVQTEDVKIRLSKVLNIPLEKIFLVPNGYGYQYKDKNLNLFQDTKVKGFLLLSTYRPNKNFEIINDVINQLKKMNIKVEFHVTINNSDYNKLFSKNKSWVINHGPVKNNDCPQLYAVSYAMFLPSHLECFSASYAEAMKMKRPILTSDLSFAHTVCGDAALYFNNNDPTDIAKKIKLIIEDKELYNKLVECGTERLKTFFDSKQQAMSYIKICNKIIEMSK